MKNHSLTLMKSNENPLSLLYLAGYPNIASKYPLLVHMFACLTTTEEFSTE